MGRIDEYREALRIAEEALLKADLLERARCAGVDITFREDETACLHLSFFAEHVSIWPGSQFSIKHEQHGTELALDEKIIICHYLLRATGRPASGSWITFRQIPDGHFYDDAFQKRTRTPFLAVFGRNPGLFRLCAETLRGTRVATGDLAMEFRVLPRIPIQLVLWQGDAELPPESTILFDANIPEYFPAEDVAVLSGMLVYRLINNAKTLK